MFRYRPFRWFTVLPLLAFQLCVPARATVLYVNKNAAGATHDGASWSTAFLTIQEGLSAAKRFDEVWVAAPLPAAPAYVESITMGNGVSLYGGFAGTETQRSQRDWKANQTIIDGNRAPVVITVPSTVATQAVIDGFTVRNGSAGSDTQVGSGIWAGGPAVISNTIITGNAGIGVSACAGTTILNDVICGNGGNGVSASGSDKYLRVTISSSTICGNEGDGVFVDNDFTAAFVRGATICGNGGNGISATGDVDVANTIIAYNYRYGLTKASYTTVPFMYNDVCGNALGDYSGFTPVSSARNLSVDPKLTSLYYNVHIQPGSPCIDAGIDSYILGTNDIDGQARIAGAHVDIGSDESDGTAWPASGPTLFVSPNGSDAADGLTWATAKKTVTAALYVAKAGSAVWVAKGTYVESVTVPFDVGLYGGFDGTESELSQRSVASNPTVLDGGGGSGDVVTCWSMNVVVDGFTIRNGGNGITKNGGTAVIANNAVSGNSKSGVYIWGTAALSNNTVTGNVAYGIYISGTVTLVDNAVSRNGTGVYMDNYSTGILTGNSISQNSTTGVYANCSGPVTLIGNTIYGNGDVGVESNSTLTLANNTICGNGQDGVSSYGEAHLSNNTIVGNGLAGINTAGLATLVNNIIATNGGYGVNNTGTLSAFSHNDVYGNAGGAYYQYTPAADQGNIYADPKLSSLYHDVHLQPGSPCIDAGDDSAVTPGQTDVYGKPRIIGAHVDIGADESDGTVWTVPSRVWYVSPSGSDSADGLTWGSAKKTVTAALSAAEGGDEVWVAEGIYVENVAIPCGVALYGGFAGTETARSERHGSANPTVLDGGGGSLDVVTIRFLNTVVDGFVIRRGSTGVDILSGTATLEDDVIAGNLADGVHAYGGNATLTSCTISGNSGSGVNVYDSWAATLTNDTIAGNTLLGVVAYGTASITNTIIAFNGTGGVYFESIVPPPVYSHNDVYGNGTGQFYTYTPPANTGNINVDPQLSSAFRDIHIQPGSPCIDAGDDSVVTAGQMDVYGKPRIIGAHVDIGADESDGKTWTVPSRVLFASPSGNNAADGQTWRTAKRTVAAALSVSQGGDEVWVAKGTYFETIRIPTGVELYGGFGGTETDRSARNPSGNPTVLDGNNKGDVVTLPLSGAVVDGFTIRNGRYGACVRTGLITIANNIISGNAFGGVTANFSVLTLSNNSISGNGSHGGVEALDGPVWLTATNNTISGNTGAGISLSGNGTATLTRNLIANNGAGVYLRGASVLSNNAIMDNSASGAYLFGTAALDANTIDGNASVGVYLNGKGTLTNNMVLSNGGYGVELYNGSATLTNNTISGNRSDGLCTDYATSWAANNIVSFNGRCGVSGATGSFPTWSHNDVFGNTYGQYYSFTPPASMGNISVDPMFADPSAWDCRLLLGSPCIDAGDDSVLTQGETDLDGNPRKQRAHVDIGAYEFPAPGYYSLAEAVLALRVAAGFTGVDKPGFARLNVADAGSGSAIDVSDAVLLIRKVLGPDPNP